MVRATTPGGTALCNGLPRIGFFKLMRILCQGARGRSLLAPQRVPVSRRNSGGQAGRELLKNAFWHQIAINRVALPGEPSTGPPGRLTIRYRPLCEKVRNDAVGADGLTGKLMTILAHLSHKGVPVADITYRPGLHVEVRVAKEYQPRKISYPLTHSENGYLDGTWEEALDSYFNDGRFDSKTGLFPGEMRRVGSAREHRTLFRQAIHALMKDLELHGYEIRVEFL